MIVVLWILNILLAVIFLGVGGMKVLRSRDALAARFMPWAADFAPTTVRLIGVAEVLGGLGLVLPLLTGIAPLLAPIAAIGLTLAMIVAGAVHVRRHETPAPAVVAGILTIASAVIGFITL
ncbi:DoxX family protein [Microbacterium sp. RURRCA19A]|uniref:DoxX family protein n=1 Tax=Microbacterium sp. RURRCA19A TaxID=1907391 RepID=UPI0009565333|nr:DoxX family protein [Microbacterium sp. RURRCA19A]SIR56272.1 DoxX-like family protein [Microbacterium sp. RURRCA19A]